MKLRIPRISLDAILKINTIVSIFVLIGVVFAQNVEVFKLENRKAGQVAGAFVTSAPMPTIAPTATPTPIPVGNPASISIPSLSLNAPIEPVGVTSNYTMDIPHNVSAVGWFTNGVKPGEQGAAIVNGHFDTSSGRPAVFFNLEKIQQGNKIIITDAAGVSRTFAVEKIATFPLNDVPKEEVYGTYDGKGIRIITCDGVWNRAVGIYSHRLVVTAKLISS